MKRLLIAGFATLAFAAAASAQQLPSMTTQTANINRTPLQEFDVPAANSEAVIAIAKVLATYVVGKDNRWQARCRDMPASLFIVRATISDPARRAAFDDWYRKDHLPWAVKAFGAQKAWRCWSETDPSQHVATYRFADRAALDRGTTPEIMKPLVEDFDRVWPGIPRTREVMTMVEEIAG